MDRLPHGLKIIFASIIVILTFFIDAKAQDANYWTHQYGSRSTLLGGAVIGSVLDLSATYYNPGALSLIDEPDVLLAAKVFEYPNYTIKSHLFNDIKLNSSTIGPAPSMVTANFDFSWLGLHRLALSFLTRYDLSFELANMQVLSPKDFEINDFISNFYMSEDLKESWFGISWSYKWKKKIGIGITQYFVSRTHSASVRTQMEQIVTEHDLITAMESKHYNYDHYSFLWKTGITFDFIGQTIGLTLTTPSVGLGGTGSSAISTSIIALNDTNGPKSYIAADVNKDVNANFKRPLAIGLGSTFKIEDTNIYVSVEWFNGMDEYDVLPARTFTSQTGGDTLINQVYQELKSVLNVGVGIQHTFDKSFTVNASFTTDFSANVPGSDSNLSLASWDIYHFMVGSSFLIDKSKITLGLGYSFGNDYKNNDKLFSSDKLPGDIPDNSPDEFEFTYQSYKFVVGFSF